MGLTLSYTFTAGTKAKSGEVNTNFSDVVSFVDGLEVDIATNTADIATLTSGKADKNGNLSNRFAVANPVTGYDAVNKTTLDNKIVNSINIIDGMIISKDTDNTIAVTAGSCYDSTKTTPIVFSTSLTEQNSTQSVSTTYYVYAIAKADNTSKVLISTSSSSPALPSGYTLYRAIGKYTTDSANKINVITNYSSTVPTEGYKATLATSGYAYLPNGLIIQWGTCSLNATTTFPITFPTECTSVCATPATSTVAYENAYTANITVSSFYFGTAVDGVSGKYIAVGY